LNNLLVMKFGGTSMGSAERIRVAAGIIAAARRTRPVVAVVSAMSKVTDLLLDTLRRAEAADRSGLDANLDKLRQRHLEACRELLPAEKQSEVAPHLEAMIADFARIAGGIHLLGERPPRSVDEAVAVGERLSARLIAAYLEAQGVAARDINAAGIVVTDAVFGNANPLMAPTRERAQAQLTPLLEQGVVPVVTGFNGATADGRPTTLGRGGSDFSASILASALDAAELWMWADVAGIMPAAPRLVPHAAVLDEVMARLRALKE
jgi:aspartate kinase